MFQRLKHILAAIVELCVGCAAVARLRIHDSQDTQFVACHELVANKVYGPDIIGINGCLAVIPELGFYPAVGVLLRNRMPNSL
jgi:hypothetical protein